MKRTLHTALTAIVLACTAYSGTALAEAPMVKTQAPGYYRTMVGDFEVNAISDGTVKLQAGGLLECQARFRKGLGRELEFQRLAGEVDS